MDIGVKYFHHTSTNFTLYWAKLYLNLNNEECTQAIKERERKRRNYKAVKTPLKYELWKIARQASKDIIKKLNAMRGNNSAVK
jgi:hypothetical protein